MSLQREQLTSSRSRPALWSDANFQLPTESFQAVRCPSEMEWESSHLLQCVCPLSASTGHEGHQWDCALSCERASSGLQQSIAEDCWGRF